VVLTPALGLPLWRYLALFVLIGIGMAAYFISGQMIGAFKLSEFKRAMKRG
jgi:putative peptidoglycan lipid II flippase